MASALPRRFMQTRLAETGTASMNIRRAKARTGKASLFSLGFRRLSEERAKKPKSMEANSPRTSPMTATVGDRAFPSSSPTWYMI